VINLNAELWKESQINYEKLWILGETLPFQFLHCVGCRRDDALQMAFSFLGFLIKFMQESHSHFAFYGWVSARFIFLLRNISAKVKKNQSQKYQWMMIFNQIGSYGMLFSFLYGGYFWLSIVFSSVALFTGFAYFGFLLFDTKHNKNPEMIWLKSGAFLPHFLR
jgi:hypothetical protein